MIVSCLYLVHTPNTLALRLFTMTVLILRDDIMKVNRSKMNKMRLFCERNEK